jgi:hypothetical protein
VVPNALGAIGPICLKLARIVSINGLILLLKIKGQCDKVYLLLAHGQWFCPATLWHLPPLKLVAMI